ncbi:serine/threonine protein kinase, CMGC, CDC2/CDK sub [Teratosphaeriaceae sp. CCFEE 6253]|nr:serine/threonine protein kinase, CMGC, CDC2/CDK sub [Teratosphaeriaceae sp. CCFEE 6253]
MAQVGSPPSTMTDPTQRRFRGSAKITEFDILDQKLGEGTFGIVSKARSKRTGNFVALKKILMHNEKDGFPITALREVKLLKMLSHPNVLRLEEMAVERQQAEEKGKKGNKKAILYMVMPYMDHDLSGMLTNPEIKFSVGQIKCYMHQLLEGLRYLHDSHILHRDMKAANILISNRGILQIADFGLARNYEGVTPQPGRGNGEAVRDYTSLVVTRWYRPPELLLTLKKYTPAIDLWGVGCIFGEMFERKPILEGRTDLDQCHRIFQLVGAPTESTMPGWADLPGCEGTKVFEFNRGDIEKRFGSRIGPEGLDLLKQLLCLDWRERINAIDALQHDYFKTQPHPSLPEDLPRYEDSHELDSRRRGHEKQRAPPPAPAGGAVGMGADEWNGPGPPAHQNGYNYNYNDRGPSRGNGQERGPPGVLSRGYDDRRSRGPSAPRGPPARQPEWRERDHRPAPTANGHPLPPRPPGDPSARPYASSQGPPPSRPPRGGGPDIDTYIPAYTGSDRNDRPPPREHDRGAGRRGSRENAYRDHDAPTRDRDRAPYQDADAPQRYRDSNAPYRDRDRGGSAGGFYGDRRTRSRSPGRPRGKKEDDMERERQQNRERGPYGGR